MSTINHEKCQHLRTWESRAWPAPTPQTTSPRLFLPVFIQRNRRFSAILDTEYNTAQGSYSNIMHTNFSHCEQIRFFTAFRVSAIATTFTAADGTERDSLAIKSVPNRLATWV